MKKMITIALIVLVAAAVQADVVSVNFHEYAAQTVGTTAAYGVESVLGWNNVQTTTSGLNLLNDASAATTLGYNFSNTGGGINYTFDGGIDTGTIFKSGYGIFALGGQLIISDISYAEYDLILYLGGPVANIGTQGAVTNSAAGTTTFALSATPAFDEATGSLESGNYVRWDGLTDSSVTLDFARLSPTGSYNVSGFQVVAIPEPATALLFGIGGMGAFIIRRNKKNAQEEADA